MQKLHLGHLHSPSMETTPSSTPFQDLTEASPKPSKKTTFTSFMTAPSFKEDTYFVSHLKPSEKKALQDLRDKLKASSDSSNPASMWGVPLLDGGDRGDVLLLKFLRARDFRVHDALNMLLKCLAWRTEFGADNIVEEELGFKELEGVVAYTHGYDREGHPVCYNAYGVFKDKEMYERVFGDEEKLQRFLRWRVQVLERGVKMLHFKPGGINSLIQIFINVPWYFSVLYSMFSPFLTQRTKSKFLISKEGNAAETLYKFIRPENIPVRYGGLSRPSDLDNGPPKPASEFTVKAGEKVNIQIEGIESGATITWDIVVGGWDLEYSAEFVPIAQGNYTLAVDKARKIEATEEAIHNSFTSKEAGKMVLSVDNSASRKKKLLLIAILCANAATRHLQSFN
ncbi:hypothetical protein ACSQ67_016258 [Phaseolus vulgaris]